MEEFTVAPEFSFLVYIVVMTSMAVLLMLVLVILLEIKMNKILGKLDNMSHETGQFVKLGLKFFSTKTDR